MEKHKILTFVQYYAPNNMVGAFRHLKLSKYLERQGFKQYIFTSEYSENINLKLNDDIPQSATIFRKKIAYFPEINALKGINVKPTFWNMLKYSIKDLLFSPDKYIWWALALIPKMRKLVKREKIQFMMISGSPFSFFIVGYFIKKLCGIKLILDYRDPWSNCHYAPRQHFIRRSIIRFWERKCLYNADLVTVCTETMAQYLQERYEAKTPIIVLPNGFDIEDFTDTSSAEYVETGEAFRFVYTGIYNLSSQVYEPTTFIEAFCKFTQKYNITDSRLILAGGTNEATLDYIKSLDNKYIITNGLLPKHKAYQLQKSADVLIQFCYPQTPIDAISLKVCEYAICRKPIISFNIKEGAMYNLLKDKELGETANSHDIDEMVELYYKAYCKDIKICENPVERLKDFNVEHTASVLAGHLRKMLD